MTIFGNSPCQKVVNCIYTVITFEILAQNHSSNLHKFYYIFGKTIKCYLSMPIFILISFEMTEL